MISFVEMLNHPLIVLKIHFNKKLPKLYSSLINLEIVLDLVGHDGTIAYKNSVLSICFELILKDEVEVGRLNQLMALDSSLLANLETFV